jgi:hypothetical protein
MIYLFTVAAPARSGTQWFARLFTTELSFCYHELTTVHRGLAGICVLEDTAEPWLADHDFEQAQRRYVLQWLPDYFPRHWERANFGQHIVGNSDHFVVGLLPALWMLWPDMRFILSSRNGINAVHSRAVTAAQRPWFLRSREEHAWKTDDAFAQACHRWTREVEDMERSRAHLEGRAQILRTTLEKVTTDINELQRVWQWLGIDRWTEHEERNRHLMSTPVNRHVPGPPAGWEQIWHTWTPSQRDTFREICGASQRGLGYEVP